MTMTTGKIELLFFEEWVIIDFLSKIKNYSANSKYIELLISLSLIKFCERQWDAKCWVGIELKNKYKKKNSQKQHATYNELNEIMTKQANEDTPVDVTIAKIPERQGHSSYGMHFQIKRFGVSKDKQDTQSLINFLNNDCAQYGKSQTNLIILIESPEEIDLQLLKQSIKTDSYPFEKIILTGLSESKYINYYGIWPESGWSRYNLDNFQFEF